VMIGQQRNLIHMRIACGWIIGSLARYAVG
jgi:hypothetical protein